MAIVHLPADLSRRADGQEVLEIDAPRIQELMTALGERFPGLSQSLEQCAVAIDGVVYGEASYRRLEPTTEVHFIPRVAGGDR